MMRRLAAVTAGVGMMLVGSAAHAQAAHSSFGEQGEFIFSADRLLPVLGYSKITLDEPGAQAPGVSKVTDSASSSNLGFFWGGTPGYASGQGVTAFPNVFTVPRLGFDYTILPNVTVGGDLVVFFTLGGTDSTETDNTSGGKQTTSTSAPTSTIFGIAPRGGYILHLNDLLSIWLRGGVSYYTTTVKQTVSNNNVSTTTSSNIDQLALDLDPQLVITPAPHFGFTVGVTGDIPLTGGNSTTTKTPNSSTSVSASASQLFVGVTGGIVAWF